MTSLLCLAWRAGEVMAMSPQPGGPNPAVTFPHVFPRLQISAPIYNFLYLNDPFDPNTSAPSDQPGIVPNQSERCAGSDHGDQTLIPGCWNQNAATTVSWRSRSWCAFRKT